MVRRISPWFVALKELTKLMIYSAAMSFLDEVTSPALKARVAELCSGDPKLMILSWLLPPEAFLQWAHSVGVVVDPTIASLVSPVPPEVLRRITAAPEQEIFLWSGARDIETFMEIYGRFGEHAAGTQARVLDFGCGCGRLTRFLNMSNLVEAFGSDINDDLAHWCQDNLEKVTTKKNDVRPPLDFASSFFHLAYSMSVFTHLPEESSRLWLAELARILAPQGIAIVTTHGYAALDIIKNSTVHQSMFGLDGPATELLANRVHAEGYVFTPLEPSIVALANAGPSYGQTFIDPGYARSAWESSSFEVLEHIPGGLRGWQDIVVMRRR